MICGCRKYFPFICSASKPPPIHGHFVRHVRCLAIWTGVGAARDAALSNDAKRRQAPQAKFGRMSFPGFGLTLFLFLRNRDLRARVIHTNIYCAGEVTTLKGNTSTSSASANAQTFINTCWSFSSLNNERVKHGHLAWEAIAIFFNHSKSHQ